jgi:hypothetical protein
MTNSGPTVMNFCFSTKLRERLSSERALFFLFLMNFSYSAHVWNQNWDLRSLFKDELLDEADFHPLGLVCLNMSQVEGVNNKKS